MLSCGFARRKAWFHINRNILFRTPRFMAFGLPSSYSIPEAPPSPDICSSRSRSSASAWETVLVLDGMEWRWSSGLEGISSGVCFCFFFKLNLEGSKMTMLH